MVSFLVPLMTMVEVAHYWRARWVFKVGTWRTLLVYSSGTHLLEREIETEQSNYHGFTGDIALSSEGGRYDDVYATSARTKLVDFLDSRITLFTCK